MTQKELEKASGVLQQTISLIESGYNTNPGIITMLKLARALRCSVYDLIDEKEGAWLIRHGKVGDPVGRKADGSG